MPSPIFARADALIQRLRPASTEVDDVPVLIDAIDLENDIPVLLDVDLPVAKPQAHVQPETMPEPVAKFTVDDEMLDDIARELARRVHHRLAAELPNIIEATIRDFLDEPDMRELLGRHD